MLICSTTLALTALLFSAPTVVDQAAEEHFEKKVWPLLQSKCLKCHSEIKPKGGLRMDFRDGLLKGGDLGPSVVLGKPAETILLKVLDYKGDIQMPPSGKLTDAEIAVFRQWFDNNLAWKKGIKPGPTKVQAHEEKPKRIEAKDYWAYQPLKKVSPPAVKNSAWVKKPIDAFILSKLEAKGLQPAPPADPVSFLRRISYDLTGLPPTPAQIELFVNDKSPEAVEKVIDRLLASPQYGEKWGRHWLDLVRFAETNGYERDGIKPFAWRYRDYVIGSFNQDKPFDRFVREQIAGDELPSRLDSKEEADRIIATGYHRLGIWDDEPADPLQARFDEYDDLVATTCQVFLGMTMNCARCHDHKIDPIPQKDYYRFLAFFADIGKFSNDRNPFSATSLTDITPLEKRKLFEGEVEARKKKIAEIEVELKRIQDIGISRMSGEDKDAAMANDREAVINAKLKGVLNAEENKEYNKFKKEHGELKKQKPPESQEFALSVNQCRVKPDPVKLLIRGNPHSPGDPVTPGFPSVIAMAEPNIPEIKPGAKTSGRRGVLADWIVGPENRLTSRVFVNRIWQHHFGRGIVATTNDFGQFGESPTHPELLDWLANDFVAGGWKVKRLHKLILLSSVYQSAGTAVEGVSQLAANSDPANTLLWKFPMRRLSAEEVRDSMLFASGNLNEAMGGPSVYPPIPPEVLAGQSVPGQGWPTTQGPEANRRSIYVHVKRSLQLPILSQHDQADTDSSCPVRYTTVVPTQALGLLNSAFTQDQAGVFAKRLLREAPASLLDRLILANRITTGRPPSAEQQKADIALISDLMTVHGMSSDNALRQFCLVALNANEFFFLD